MVFAGSFSHRRARECIPVFLWRCHLGTVQTAFGETPGAIAGDFNWISGATDNAIYPVLFLTYIAGNGGNSKYVG